MDTITLIFTSTVVSAIVTALFGFFSSKRQNTLKYITEEREKWRDEMRIIAEDVEQSKVDNINVKLTKIKVRINAYGSMMETDYQRDGHIWKLIRELEKGTESKEVFEKKKRVLIDYISLLLKADWERSKVEVRGAFQKAVKCVLALLSVILFSFYYFVIWRQNDIGEYLIHVVYIILAVIFLAFVFGEINRNMLSFGCTGNKTIFWLILSLLLYLGGMVWFGSFFIARWENWPMEDRRVILFCVILSFTLNLWDLLSELFVKYRYKKAVNQIENQ